MRAELARALERRPGVLFVCSGNMVRSAFADLYARHMGCPVPVGSAATTYRNARLFPETAAALLACGVERDAIAAFRPRHLDDLARDLEARRPVALAMTGEHLDDLWTRGWTSADAFLLDAALVSGQPRPIRDPVLEGADFAATLAHVARAVEALVAHLGD
jgi:protein-tyrosine-phosphatase